MRAVGQPSRFLTPKTTTDLQQQVTKARSVIRESNSSSGNSSGSSSSSSSSRGSSSSSGSSSSGNGLSLQDQWALSTRAGARLWPEVKDQIQDRYQPIIDAIAAVLGADFILAGSFLSSAIIEEVTAHEGNRVVIP